MDVLMEPESLAFDILNSTKGKKSYLDILFFYKRDNERGAPTIHLLTDTERIFFASRINPRSGFCMIAEDRAFGDYSYSHIQQSRLIQDDIESERIDILLDLSFLRAIPKKRDEYFLAMIKDRRVLFLGVGLLKYPISREDARRVILTFRFNKRVQVVDIKPSDELITLERG